MQRVNFTGHLQPLKIGSFKNQTFMFYIRKKYKSSTEGKPTHHSRHLVKNINLTARKETERLKLPPGRTFSQVQHRRHQGAIASVIQSIQVHLESETELGIVCLLLGLQTLGVRTWRHEGLPGGQPVSDRVWVLARKLSEMIVGRGKLNQSRHFKVLGMPVSWVVHCEELQASSRTSLFQRLHVLQTAEGGVELFKATEVQMVPPACQTGSRGGPRLPCWASVLLLSDLSFLPSC